jgi:hypothetical protein
VTVTFGAYSDNSADFAATSSHSIAVGTRGVLVLVSASASTGAVTGVTVGGVACTQSPSSPLTTASGELSGWKLSAWLLGASVPTGTQDVVISGTSMDGNVLVGVVRVTGGENIEFVDDDASISSTSLANPSATLALSGRTCFAAQVWLSGHDAVTSTTPLTSWTGRNETDVGSICGGFYTYDTIGSTDVAVGWTQTAEDALMVAAAISELVTAGSILKQVAENYYH